MDQKLMANNRVLVEAAPARVWEVLTTPSFIKQWDDLPQNFGDDTLHHGTVIEWPGYSRLSVVICEPFKRLKLSLYDPGWEHPASHYDIAYTYDLQEDNGRTLLSLNIGDFSQLPGGQEYFDASIGFANEAVLKIKQLAEEKA